MILKIFYTALPRKKKQTYYYRYRLKEKTE